MKANLTAALVCLALLVAADAAPQVVDADHPAGKMNIDQCSVMTGCAHVIPLSMGLQCMGCCGCVWLQLHAIQSSSSSVNCMGHARAWHAHACAMLCSHGMWQCLSRDLWVATIKQEGCCDRLRILVQAPPAEQYIFSESSS